MAQNDFEDFTDHLKLINDQAPTNVLDQLPAYNEAQTATFIKNLKVELDQQKTINSILKTDDADFQEHVKHVKTFTEMQGPKIQEQLRQMAEVCAQLRSIVDENTAMKAKRAEFAEISQTEAYRSVAKNMNALREQKEAIKVFLKAAGIVSPPLLI